MSTPHFLLYFHLVLSILSLQFHLLIFFLYSLLSCFSIFLNVLCHDLHLSSRLHFLSSRSCLLQLLKHPLESIPSNIVVIVSLTFWLYTVIILHRFFLCFILHSTTFSLHSLYSKFSILLLIPVIIPPLALPFLFSLVAVLYCHSKFFGKLFFIFLHPPSSIHVSVNPITSKLLRYSHTSLSLFITPAIF